LKQYPYGQGGVLLTDRSTRIRTYLEAKIDSFCNGGIFIRSTESGVAYQVELMLPARPVTYWANECQLAKVPKLLTWPRCWKPGEWNSSPHTDGRGDTTYYLVGKWRANVGGY